MKPGKTQPAETEGLLGVVVGGTAAPVPLECASGVISSWQCSPGHCVGLDWLLLQGWDGAVCMGEPRGACTAASIVLATFGQE